MTNKEERIYIAIMKHYEKKGKEVVDILYSIVRGMYLIKIAEKYIGKKGIEKIRIIKEDMLLEEVEELLNS
jgi:hypothetical protein